MSITYIHIQKADAIEQVALHELRLMRALERIEKLKQEGRWSFRQPKKQKGPVVAKSHWDWLLDEMVCVFFSTSLYKLRLFAYRNGCALISVKSDAGRWP